jgi:hypothetical protein
VLRPQRRDVLALDGRRRAQAQLIWQEALNSVMGKVVVENTAQAIPEKKMCPEHASKIGA